MDFDDTLKYYEGRIKACQTHVEELEQVSIPKTMAGLKKWFNAESPGKVKNLSKMRKPELEQKARDGINAQVMGTRSRMMGYAEQVQSLAEAKTKGADKKLAAKRGEFLEMVRETIPNINRSPTMASVRRHIRDVIDTGGMKMLENSYDRREDAERVRDAIIPHVGEACVIHSPDVGGETYDLVYIDRVGKVTKHQMGDKGRYFVPMTVFELESSATKVTDFCDTSGKRHSAPDGLPDIKKRRAYAGRGKVACFKK